MAAIHHIKVASDLIRSGAVSPELLEDLFRTIDESVSYELEVGDGVTAAALPGFGAGAAAIETIQTFIFVTNTNITLNWNGANTSLVVATGNRRAVFMAYGVSTTTVPTVTNSSGLTATINVLAGGT